MQAIGSVIWSVPRTIGHGVWHLFSLIHNWDEVSETYGPNPNGASEQQLAAGNLAANLIGGAGTSSM